MQVLVDTREQKPWQFTFLEWPDGCVRHTFKTGDYSLAGFEDQFVIDRKGSVIEVAQNLLQPRFERELERLDGFAHAYIICDFPLRDLEAFPDVPEMPQYLRSKIRARGKFLRKLLDGFRCRYKTQWFFCEKGQGKFKALELFHELLTPKPTEVLHGQ